MYKIFRHVFSFFKEENGKIDGSVHSTNYRPSPIPAGGLEIPMILNFKSTRYLTHKKRKEFMTSLYSYEYEPQTETSPSDDEEEIDLIIEELSDDNSEVVKPKKKRKLPVIDETSESEKDDEGGNPLVKPRKIEVRNNEDVEDEIHEINLSPKIILSFLFVFILSHPVLVETRY